jgi:hypothetical protein
MGNRATVAQTIVNDRERGGLDHVVDDGDRHTPSAGEYEGLYVPAGSSLRVLTSGVSLLGGLQMNVYGFIRFINSTRAE